MTQSGNFYLLNQGYSMNLLIISLTWHLWYTAFSKLKYFIHKCMISYSNVTWTTNSFFFYWFIFCLLVQTFKLFWAQKHPPCCIRQMKTTCPKIKILNMFDKWTCLLKKSLCQACAHHTLKMHWLLQTENLDQILCTSWEYAGVCSFCASSVI